MLRAWLREPTACRRREVPLSLPLVLRRAVRPLPHARRRTRLSLMPDSHRPPDTTRRSCLCRVRRCELSRPDKCVLRPECVRRSHRQCLCRQTHSDAERTCRADSSHRRTRHDKTVLCLSCLVCRCELNVFRLHVFCRRQFFGNPIHTAEADATQIDKTVLLCLAWRRELALRRVHITYTELNSSPAHTCKLRLFANSTVNSSIGIRVFGID